MTDERLEQYVALWVHAITKTAEPLDVAARRILRQVVDEVDREYSDWEIES